MKKLYLFVILAIYGLGIQQIQAQSNFAWAKSAGTSGIDDGYDMAVDNSGNIYVTGSFENNPITFDTVTVSNAGSYDGYIVKYDPSGNVLWAKNVGGASDDRGWAIATDDSGYVYAVGSFMGSAVTVGGSALNNQGGADVYVVKYDSSGNVVWARSEGGSTEDRPYSVVVDHLGNVDIAGYTIFSGSKNIYLLKFDALGNVKWSKNIGGSADEEATSIAVDTQNNIYVTGYFASSSVSFDTITVSNSGGFDIFLAKYDTAGNVNWVKKMGSTSIEWGECVTLDPFGNIYTTGYFTGTVDFDPDTGTSYLTSSSGGYYDIFIQKLDASGNFAWAKSMGGAINDYGFSIALDPVGNIYTSGSFQATADFNPDAGVYNLSSAGNNDIFISKLNPTGDFVWAKAMGGTSDDGAHTIALDPSGNIYVTGYFQGTADFDPDTTSFNLTSAGAEDMFIFKLGCTGQATIVGKVTYQLGNISSANILLLNADSTGQFLPTQTTSVDTGGNYAFSNIPDGNYTIQVVPDTAVYHANVMKTYYGNQFLWDSASVISAVCGGSYTANISATYIAPLAPTGARIAGYILADANYTGKTTVQGDPIPGVDVSIEQSPSGIIIASTQSKTDGSYIFTNVPQGTFRILTTIPGYGLDSSRTVQITSNTDVITQQNYLVSDSTIYINGDSTVVTGNNPIIKTNNSPARIFPNPNNGIFTLQLGETNSGLVTITDMLGKVVYKKQVKNKEGIDLSNQPKGIYFISLVLNNLEFRNILTLPCILTNE